MGAHLVRRDTVQHDLIARDLDHRLAVLGVNMDILGAELARAIDFDLVVTQLEIGDLRIGAGLSEDEGVVA